MIPFKFSPTVRFTVAGTINDDKGVAQPFSFWLICERWTSDRIDAFLKTDDKTLRDLMLAVAQDWGDVIDSGEPVPFSADNLDALLKQPGVAVTVFKAYAAEAGAKAKN